MASTLEYHTEHIKCPECGTNNEIELVNEYDTMDGSDDTDYAGYQICIKCMYIFTADDLEHLPD